MPCVEKTVNVSPWLLKKLSRMYENGISITEISRQLEMSPGTVQKILTLLGYKIE
jgi:DNA-binding IclR family transcriptional regulator